MTGTCHKPALRHIRYMKSLVLALALFGTVIGQSQKADAATVIYKNCNWNDPYWHTHKYGYWNDQKGYWRIKNGRHVFVVVQ
jgi:hypothetical protein